MWLAITNILCDQTCRSKYQIDDFRQGSIARLKRHFNEVLFDQLPLLKDTQRAVDEIMLNVVPTAADVRGPPACPQRGVLLLCIGATEHGLNLPLCRVACSCSPPRPRLLSRCPVV